MIELFPMLYWTPVPNCFLGQLIGTDSEQMAPSLLQLQKSMTELAHQLRDEEGFEPPILSCESLILEIKYTPTYRAQKVSFPASYELVLKIFAVYGLDEDQEQICYLPMTGQMFNYYQPRQRDELIRYYAQKYLSQLSPEEATILQIQPLPKLTSVRYDVKKRSRKQRANFWDLFALFGDDNSSLQEVADKVGASSSGNQTHPVWERGEEVELGLKWVRRERAHLLIIGERGVGKSSILREIARQALRLYEITFWETSPQRLIAGSKYLGDWEERCENVVEELSASSDYLWMNQINYLTEVGGDTIERSVATFLYPFLKARQLSMVGELTPRELDALRLKLPQFVELFKIVNVAEMGAVQTKRLCTYFQQRAENKYQVKIEREALESAYLLLARFERQSSFPGKAVKFLDDCLSDALLKQRDTITRTQVVQAFSERSGLPEVMLRDELTLNESELSNFFESRIIGQDPALEQIYQIIKLFKVGLNDPHKPISTLLFAGPTGVGKTACVHAIADYFFGQGQRKRPLIQLDMSEFQHPAHIERLLGVSGESRGSAGKLIEQVRESPFCVILLDEIEKAHPVVFDVLLSVFDEGVLYDVFGRATYFYNTIIIMTSNLGADRGRGLGFTSSSIDPFIEGVKAFFRPEFFNRIDSVIPFALLNSEVILKIARKELQEVGKREGIKKRKLKLSFTERLIEEVAQAGFHPEYGARPLQRAVERYVVAPFSHYLARYSDLEDQEVLVDWVDGEVLFSI